MYGLELICKWRTLKVKTKCRTTQQKWPNLFSFLHIQAFPPFFFFWQEWTNFENFGHFCPASYRHGLVVCLKWGWMHIFFIVNANIWIAPKHFCTKWALFVECWMHIFLNGMARVYFFMGQEAKASKKI